MCDDSGGRVRTLLQVSNDFPKKRKPVVKNKINVYDWFFIKRIIETIPQLYLCIRDKFFLR